VEQRSEKAQQPVPTPDRSLFCGPACWRRPAAMTTKLTWRLVLAGIDRGQACFRSVDVVSERYWKRTRVAQEGRR
jgi:hypothetical protein